MKVDVYKKILVIRLSSFGDILLTTPMLRSLRSKYPQAQIDYCVRSEYKEILEYNPHISEIIEYTKSESRIVEIKNQISNAGYDVVIDLQHNLRSRNLLKGIPVKVYQFNKQSLKKFLLVNFKLNMMRDLPPIPVRYAETLPGLELDDKGLEVGSPGDIRSELPDSGNLIAFCPGSRHYTKMWPHEYYTDLGEILTLRGYKIVLLGGKQDQGICRLIASGIQGAINLCNDNDMFKTIAHMKKCALVVANDSGLMHLACAAKVPVITVFGSTVKEFGFTPFQNPHEVVENSLAKCRPCSHFGRDKCPKKHFNCMMKNTPAMLFQRITYFLSRQ